jgi:hypothetical protein
MLFRNRICYAPNDGGTGAGAGGTGGGATTFAWDPALPAEQVDLLKAKGMYDDPVKGAPMLVKSYFEANKALSGGDVIVFPKGDDPEFGKKLDETVFTKTRGVAKFEEYEAKLPDGAKVHMPAVDFAKKLAFEWGVPKAKFQAGIDAYQQFAIEASKNIEDGGGPRPTTPRSRR